jgi:hypothetical protein
MPPGTKKQKESQEHKHEAKKRKSSSSSAPKVKKDGKGSRKTGRELSRRASPMPKVDEEAGIGKEPEMTQADIDSKCYELTVQPLADVSQAYGQSPALAEHPATSGVEKVKFCPITVRGSIKRCISDRSPHFPLPQYK